MLRALLILTLASVLGAGPTGAQARSDQVASIAPRVIHTLPFKTGESLVYEVSFSKYIFSGTIGELKLMVGNRAKEEKGELIELQAEAVSKGFFPKIFGIKVRDRFHSVVSSKDFGLHTATRLIEEGSVRREQKSVVNREAGRVTYTDRDLVNEKAEPRVHETAAPTWVQDTLSACYFVRTQKLNQGDVISVPISDGPQVYNIDVIVGKREKIKVDARKFDTVVLEVKAFDGRYVKRSGEMFIWVTDDEKRIPVRAKIKTSGATVSIELKQAQQSK